MEIESMKKNHWPIGTPWWREEEEKKMSNGDWEKLDLNQQKEMQAWRDHISKILIEERESFESAHPELRLNYNFTSEPLLRAEHPLIREEL